MKKTIKIVSVICSILVIVFVAFVFLKPSCKEKTSKNGFYDGKSKTSQMPKKDEKSDNDTLSTSITEISESSGAELNSSVTEQIVTSVEQNSSGPSISGVINEVALASLVSGDYSTISGTWINAKAERIRIDDSGTVTYSDGEVYSLASGRLENNCYYTTIYNSKSEYDNASFIGCSKWST
ncbi:DUF6287 domain-containing protein [Streptococcus sp. S784/96/1]|uniref:DUF6287 domain-containing protein n=1 Tax=Streptococcus sp. S784/96/1 TaxID=2653499 RepID=UPI001386630F|nr:DUF6287 domain-containing protein [Streptococcus sp. S784/96/1]